MTRTVPNAFAALTSPTLPNLDADFVALAPGNVLPCTATGTNTVALTPVTSTLTVTAYSDKELYSFVAAATSTGAVTVNVSSAGAINLLLPDQVTQAGNGSLVIGHTYVIAYSSGLSGFVIVGPSGKQPTRTVLTSGSGTYTTPAGATRINVRLVGGGAGGGAATTNNGTVGNNTTFGTLTGSGGTAGIAVGGSVAPGGSATGGDLNLQGGSGQSGANSAAATIGGQGGSSPFGGVGGGGGVAQAGGNAAANTGSGGGGGGVSGTSSGGGGGSGGYCEKLFSGPAATYSYGVGAAANGGAAGGFAGGNGAAGLIIIDEFYN